MEKASAIAMGNSAKARIDENLKTVINNTKDPDRWCGKGYWQLPKPVLTKLEQAREKAELKKWEDTIKILDALLNDKKPLPADQQILVEKCYGWTLNRKAVARLNTAMEQFSRPLQALEEAALKSKLFGLLGRQSTNYYGQQSIYCDHCGASIVQYYTKFTYQGQQFNFCPTCASKVEREQNERKAELRRALQEAASELRRGWEFDTDNTQIKENYDFVIKTAKELVVEIPALSKALVITMKKGRADRTTLIKALKDSDPEVRKAAWQGLKKMDPATYQTLRKQQRVRRLRNSALAFAAIVLLWLGGSYLLYLDGSTNAAMRLHGLGLVSNADLIRMLEDKLSQSPLEDQLSAAKELINQLGSAAKEQATPVLITALKTAVSKDDALTRVPALME
ncbi:MAG: HEAT repeat domain-containing protein, partial [Candidatus Zhuqueibacterota bacterium]